MTQELNQISAFQVIFQERYHDSATGYKGLMNEATIDPLTTTLWIHDALTVGGRPLRIDWDDILSKPDFYNAWGFMSNTNNQVNAVYDGTIVDFIEGGALSISQGANALTFNVSKAGIESVLTGEITSHTHLYDNYDYWTMRVNGTTSKNISSNGLLNLTQGNNVTLAYNTSTDTVTVNAANNYPNLLDFNTATGVLTLGISGLTSLTKNLDGRYLTSFTEEDPTVPAFVKAITATDISEWDQAYSWLNATGVTDGYVLTAASGVPVWAENTGLPAGTTGDILYYNSGWQSLAIGTTDYVLSVVSGAPAWVEPVLDSLWSDHEEGIYTIENIGIGAIPSSSYKVYIVGNTFSTGTCNFAGTGTFQGGLNIGTTGNWFNFTNQGFFAITGTQLLIDINGYFRLKSSTDAAAPNNSFFYSTDGSKAAYKDPGGTTNYLY